MERMAVSVATGVLTSLLSKLSVLLSDEFKNLKGVRRDIESLSRELTDMNAALVKLADREKLDVQTKVWRDKVREMAYDIEDIIDIFMHHHDQAGDDKDSLFQKTARKIRKLRARFQIAGMIQDIKSRVVEQSQSRDRYKVEESVSEPKLVEVDPRLAAMYEDAKRLVGMDGPQEKIIKQLIEEDGCESGQLRMLSIAGFGGIGKTTLANQVYAKIRNEFECTAFVSVSRTPHMPKILKDILSEVGYGDTKKMEDDVPKLIEIVRATLRNKRYFVIIDDLWSIKDWDIIKCAFVESNNASRVITTTRIQEVAIASCVPNQGHVYQMQPLNELHSRRLFFKRLFGTEDSCPEQLREISDQMLKKCKGVPLAITSIASLLANQSMHIEIWEKIHNSLGSELDTNPTLEWMRHVLSLSYNDLSHELKTCLLYLGIYPEDYKIDKGDLVRKWIAEGFIREKHGLDLEEAAENCFNELINRNMIQASWRAYDFGEVLNCQVHDLMLDLIILKCKEENFITIIDKKYPMNGAQVRRISHQFRDRDMYLTVESMNASKVRSFISFSVAHGCVPPISKFELLRVLDMDIVSSDRSMCLDLSAINQLFLLKYVKVHGFLELPKKFGKLNQLMTLDISLSKLDIICLSDFNSLSSLRHLSITTWVTYKNGLSKLSNLRSLCLFDIRVNSIECIRDLGELINLRNLCLCMEDGIESNPKMTVLAASLNKLGNSNLRHLGFEVLSRDTSSSAQLMGVLMPKLYPRHLEGFTLTGVLMPKLPNWIVYADRLASAVLGVQELRNDDVQVLGQLPSLIYLDLTAATIPENNIIIHPKTFHSLNSFGFFCDELPRLTFEPASMPKLQRLQINLHDFKLGGMQLQEVISPVGGIEHLASLEEISINVRFECSKIETACRDACPLSINVRNEWSKIESACRDAISRHPKSQAMKIHVECIGKPKKIIIKKIVRKIVRKTVAVSSGKDYSPRLIKDVVGNPCPSHKHASRAISSMGWRR